MANNNENARLMGKRSMWPWVLLGLLLLVAVIVALTWDYGKDNVSVSDQAANQVINAGERAVNNAPDPAPSVITNIDEILSASTSNLSSFQGRRVQFDNMTVKSVGTDDMVFWINNAGAASPAQNQGRDLFAYMNPQVQSQARGGGTTPLKDGQKVKISGVMRMLPTDDVIRTQWKLNANDTAYLKNKVIYLDAESVTLIQ
jgi:hypothetical protein